MRFAFFGDIVGRSGREGLADHLPGLRRRLGLDFVIVNAENAAAGFGITENTARELFEAGADCLTLGNHSWDQKEALTYIVREHAPDPARSNYPVLADAPGRGAQLFETERRPAGAGDQPAGPGAHGRPGRSLRRGGQGAERLSAGRGRRRRRRRHARRGHLGEDGHGPLLRRPRQPGGGHPHPRAHGRRPDPDGGTAYQTDAGACADYDSVIGNQKEEPLRRFTTRISGGRFRPAEGPATVCGVFVETDDLTGLARRIEPIRVGGRLSQSVPVVAVAQMA